MGKLVYDVVEGWGKLPGGWSFKQVAGVAVDSRDRVYVLNRGEHPVIVFSREGEFLASWGEGVFANPHGAYIDSDDNVFCVDNADHTVRKFTAEGELLMTIGTKGVPGEDGAPFNRPTKAALAPDGELYVSDGYGNNRVHRYDSEGEHILSWGEAGEGPGQFNLPHGVWYRDGRVYVADRQNDRIQIFTPEGDYVEEWTGLIRPCDLYIDGDGLVYVPELRHRVSILNLDGELLARWGGEESRESGLFVAPHCAWTDSEGSLYVGEVLEGQRVQKFVRA